MVSHARKEIATELQVLLTRLDVLKSLVGHDCGVGRGSQAVRCELVCVGRRGYPMDPPRVFVGCKGARCQTLGVRVDGSRSVVFCSGGL